MSCVTTRAIRLAVAVAVLGLVGPAPASRAQTGDETPTLSPETLDVVVTDRQHRAVDGLTVDDMSLLDDGVPQRIDGLETASTGPRVVGIFLDEFHVGPESSDRVRDVLSRFVTTQLGDADRVAIAAPLDAAEPAPDATDVADLGARISEFVGRRGDYTPRTTFEATFLSRAASSADRERAQVTLAALQALAVRLGAQGTGRKTLILVSEGFVVRSGRRRGRSVSVEGLLQSIRQHGVAVYAADPSPPETSERPAEDEEALPENKRLLRTLVARSGGRDLPMAQADVAAADAAWSQAVRDQERYYRVTYTPDHPADGRRRPLEVQVARRDADIRFPDAHWARRELERPAPRRTALTRALLRPQRISPLIRPWFGISRGTSGSTELTITWEPNSRALSEPASIRLHVATPEGRVLYDGRLEPVRPGPPGARDGMLAVITAPPGLVQLDMDILALDGRTLGVDARNLDIPDLATAGTRLSTPAILRARTAREFRELASDSGAPPVVSREFHRRELLLVRVRASAASDRTPPVAARLVGTDRQTLRDLAPLPDPPAPDIVQFELGLSSLAHGRYGIEITAGPGEEGEATAREFVEFAVR